MPAKLKGLIMNETEPLEVRAVRILEFYMPDDFTIEELQMMVNILESEKD